MIEVTLDHITYYIDEEHKTASVFKVDKDFIKGALSLPSRIMYHNQQYPITSIRDCAFFGREGLTSITIPKSVTNIGKDAFFGCESLTSITIPESVTNIGKGAFEGCEGLTSMVVEMGNKVYDCRNNCNAIIETATNILTHGCKNTIIPDSVTNIGEGAFNGCSGLSAITIPNSVTNIGHCAFEGCSSLTSITIPESVTNIGDGAFYGCYGLTTITIPESVTNIGESAFEGCSSLTSITIPNSVTSIECGAFGLCNDLTSITIPDSVTSIGGGAFECCFSLTSITIPKSVTSIGGGAFECCSSLTSITIPESVTSIGGGAFECCSSLTSITIPESVTSIGDWAFHGCSGLTTINIPNSVTSIGRMAFRNCFGLTTITIPNSVTSIGDYAFLDCSGLTSVTIPKSVTCIGHCAFKGCSGLTSITIPNSVTSIGGWAFADCSGLTSIILPNTLTEINTDIFKDCESLSLIRIPRGMKETFCQMGLEEWRDIMQEEICTIENVHYALDYSAKTAMVIAHGANKDICLYEGSVVIPARIKVEDIEFAVTEIEANAFARCEALLSVTLPKGLTAIGADAFNDCENLSVIRVPKGTKAGYCNIGLTPWQDIAKEPQEEEYTILLNIARGYELGIGMAKNLAQAAICYIQAADKGCAEAAFHLGELYETGQGLPKDLKQAADWYAKATALYHPLSAARQKACLQQIETTDDVYFLCLANSYKHGNRCIAGVRMQLIDNHFELIFDEIWDTAIWFRPVSHDRENAGAIPNDEAIHIHIFDIVKVTNIEACPEGAQTENHYYSTLSVVQTIQPTKELLDNIAKTMRKVIFGSKYANVSREYYESHMDYSIMMVCTSNVKCYNKERTDKGPQPRMCFLYRDTEYDFPVTDPLFRKQIETDIDKANSYELYYLTLSLGVRYNDSHFKLIAGVIPFIPMATKVNNKKSITPSDSFELSFSLFQQLGSIDQVAEKRGLTVGTICSHLIPFVESGKIDIHALVSIEHIEKITAYRMSHRNETTLKPCYEFYGGNMSYDEIRLVFASLKNMQKE